MGLARLGVVLANVFTVGLVNIGWRIQQERRRAKRLNKVVQITENHSSPLERKINMFVDYACYSLSIKPYQNFREDLKYFLSAQFGLAREERDVDERFIGEFQKLVEDVRTGDKIEAIYKLGQNL